MSVPGVSCPNCGYDSTNVLPRLYDASSPFQHLFDDRASPEQISAARPQIKIFIDALRDELFDAEARVARLREALQAAEQTRAKAEGVLNAHIMLNPPVQFLPPEILSFIFSLTFEKPLHIFKSRMPWLLGQVCRHWRAVALQTPSLWDSFVGGDSSQKVFHWPILEDVLSRSGNSPLEVSLVGLTPGSAGVLARHASRLRELQVTCSFDGLYAFEDAPEMSILTNLCLIASTTKTIYENSPVYFDIASKAPRLTHVFLNAAVTVHITLLRIVLLPWPQITHLELELGYNNYYKCILPILSQCQNLVSFTDSHRDRLGEYFLRGPTPPSIYVFPRLTFLAIRSSLTILSCMQCPALRTFALRGVLQCGEFIEKDWLDFRAFMDRSRCTLQEVRLIPEDNRYQPAIFSAPLEEFLTFVSHVPRLVIDHTRAPYTMGLPGTLDRVAGVPGVVAFPELQMLTLKAEATALLKLLPVWAGLTLQQDVEKVLIRSVESRWRVPEGAMRIKTVRIELAVMIRYDGIVDYEDPEDLDVKKLHAMLGHTELLRRMKIFKDEGLDVSVVVCEHWSRLATLPIKERRRTYL